jgi:hypothetical protein
MDVPSVAKLTSENTETLIRALGDSWATVIATHHLRRNLADAWLVGPAEHPQAVVVAKRPQDEEPAAFGDDAAAIWAILKSLPGWTCVNVAYRVADSLAEIMRSDM